VDNSDLALLPGMTANTRIITDERNDVVRVPLRALRFVPQGLEHAKPGGDGAAAADWKPDGDGQPGPGHAHSDGAGKGRVWVLHDGAPVKVPLVTGLTDASFAEVVRGDVAPDDQVVIDEVGRQGGGGANAANRNAARPHFHM